MAVTKRNTLRTKRMALGAILTALIIIMSFTPLGYLKAGAVQITFLPIPVAVGAIILGPWWGLYFGGLFGITSFIQCFGLDPFGTALLSVNPVFTFILCLIPRLLIGLGTGSIYKLLSRVDGKKYVAVSVSAVSAAIINTLFFTILFVLFFGNTSIQAMENGTTFAQMSIFQLVFYIITTNSIIEAVACGVFGAAISKTLGRFVPEFNK